MPKLFGAFEYLTKMAEKAHTGAPPWVFWGMGEDDISFEESIDNFADAQNQRREPLDVEMFGPPDFGWLGYDVTDSSFADDVIEADEFALEKAAYQTGITNQQRQELMEQGLSVEDAMAQNPGVEGMLTPWGPALSPEAVDVIMDENPGLFGYAGVDVDSWYSMENLADQIEGKAGDDIDEMLDNAEKAAVNQGTLGNIWDTVKSVGNFLGDVLTEGVSPMRGTQVLEDMIGQEQWEDAADYAKDIVRQTLEMGFTGGTSVGLPGEEYNPRFVETQKILEGFTGGLTDPMTSSIWMGLQGKLQEEVNELLNAALVNEDGTPATPSSVVAQITELMADGEITEQDVQNWTVSSGWEESPVGTSALRTRLLGLFVTAPESPGVWDDDGTALGTGDPTELTDPVVTGDPPFESYLGTTVEKRSEIEKARQPADDGGKAGTGVIKTVEADKAADKILPQQASYYDQFVRLFNTIPGSQRAEAQQGRNQMYNEATALFYLSRKDWTPFANLTDPSLELDEDARKDEELAFSNWLKGTGTGFVDPETGFAPKPDYSEIGYFDDPKAMRYGPDFYQGVRDLRDSMMFIKDDSAEETYAKFRNADTAKQKPIMDRFVFMDPEGSTRLATLVGMYNIHPGADNWLKGRMMNFYQGMMENWKASGRDSFDFIDTFVKDRPAMESREALAEAESALPEDLGDNRTQ